MNFLSEGAVLPLLSVCPSVTVSSLCPSVCQSVSFSSVTDSTMSLNIITVTLNMGEYASVRASAAADRAVAPP